MNIMLPWTCNQSLSLQEQLEHGIRWFDIRLSYSKTDQQVYVSHTALTEHSLATILQTLTTFLEQTDSPLLFLNMRVDYQDRSHAPLIQPIVSSLLQSHMLFLANQYVCGLTVEQTLIKKKMLLYCSDGTLQDPMIAAIDLMPTVSFWDAGSIEVCEERLKTLVETFQTQEVHGSFLFPRNRMILFDYSTNAMLWYTDKQMIALMDQYKNIILDASPTILAGNQVQTWMGLF